MTDTTVFKDQVLDELTSNRDHYIELATPLLQQKNLLLKTEDVLFHSDIKKQFKTQLTSLLARDIIRVINITIEDALIILEDVDLIVYIEGT